MKVLLLAAVAALTLSTVSVFAGEGQGDPFGYNNPGVTTSTGQMKQLPGGLDNPYPFQAPGQVTSLQNYKQKAGGLDNPYPFAADGRTFQVPGYGNGRYPVASAPQHSATSFR